MADQITNVPASGGDGGMGMGMIIGIIVVILVIIGLFIFFGRGAGPVSAPTGGNDGGTEVNNNLPAPDGGGADVPSEVDVNLNNPGAAQ